MIIGKRDLLPNDDPRDLSRNCGCDVSFMDRKVSEQQRAVYYTENMGFPLQMLSYNEALSRRIEKEKERGPIVPQWLTTPSQYASPPLVSSRLADTLS